MSKHRQLLYGQPIPQDFLDSLQEFIGTMGSPNLDLTMVPGSANQVQIVAGTGSAQVSLGIDGLWRYISATTQTTVTGAAGTYDIFVTTGNNSFATNPSPPPPETDSTDYTFALSAPLIQGNVPGAAHYRKVGEAIFDGTRILSLRQTVDIDTSQGFQPGDVKTSAAAAPQAGWLLCNGQAVSRSTFAALYAALGGTSSPWGQGDGSTTFNVPDIRSRSPIGAGQGALLTNRALGTTTGEETHALLAAESGVNGNGGTGGDSNDHSHAVSIQSGTESAAHAHALGGNNVPAHTQGWSSASVVTGGPGVSNVPYNNNQAVGSLGATDNENASHSHGVNGQTGGISTSHSHALTARNADAVHNNMPPVVAVNYFVKT